MNDFYFKYSYRSFASLSLVDKLLLILIKVVIMSLSCKSKQLAKPQR